MDRERITISIRKSVLDIVDKTIDSTNIRNRSHAIENLIIKAAGQVNKEAVILLGGNSAMKAIEPTKNFLRKLSDSGFPKAHVALGFLGDKVKERLGDGSEFGIAIEYNNKGKGSGGAVASLKKIFKSPLVIFNSTKTIDIDLDQLIDYHQKYGALATIVTTNLETLDGVYALSPEALNSIPSGFSMLEEDVLPKLLKEGKAIVLPLQNL